MCVVASIPAMAGSCGTGFGTNAPGLPTHGLTLHLDLMAYRATGATSVGDPMGFVRSSAPGAIDSGVEQRDPTLRPTLHVDAESDRVGIEFDGATSLSSRRTALKAATTIAVIVTPNSASGGGTIVAASDPAGMQLRITPDGTVEAVRRANDFVVRSTVRVRSGAASVVLCTVDESEIVQLFVDGVPAGFGIGAADYPASSPFDIGGVVGKADFRGVLGEFCCWDRALDGSDLRAASDYLASRAKITTQEQISSLTVAPFRTTGIKGSNIMPKAVDITDTAWRNLWVGWDWEWIRRSVDAARDTTANAVRIVGDVQGVHSGVISFETYVARLRQLLDYARSKGCRVYYCLLDIRHLGAVPPDFVTDFAGRLGSVLADDPTVLAVEIVNEVSTGYQLYPVDEVTEWVARWSASLRRSAPTISLSISDVRSGTLLEKTNDIDAFARYAPYVDFFDLHLYYPPETDASTNVLAAYEFAVDRPFVIGETGADRDDRSLDRGATYRQIEKIFDSSPAAAGVFQWAAVNDRFGLFSETDGSEQSDIAGAWRNFDVEHHR